MSTLDSESVSSLHDIQQLERSLEDAAVFDATQYDFFGKNFVEEELGGLEEADDMNPVSYEEDEFYREELETLNEPHGAEALGDTSFNGGSGIKWDHGTDGRIWPHRQAFDAADLHDGQQWSSPLPGFSPLQPLTRPQIHREQQKHMLPQNFSPILVPKPSTSYPLHRMPPPTNHLHNLGPAYANVGQRTAFSPPDISFVRDLQLPRLAHGSRFAGNVRPANTNPMNPFNQFNIFSTNSALPHNGLMPLQGMHSRVSQKHVVSHPLQHYNPFPAGPHLAARFEHGLGLPDTRRLGTTTWSLLGSKYMTAYEIQMIPKLQLAANPITDPYVDDYYYQASVAKKSAAARSRHHPFYPTYLKDDSVRARPSSEPHPFLQVEGLGRLTFSSTRRPRALLEIDASDPTASTVPRLRNLDKPLEQEPMLAARVAIEDGFSILLDVDDIDRFLRFNHLQDGGAQLRKRRQVLLEGLTSALQLPKNDHVFVMIVSVPKGRKLLLRYIQLLNCEIRLLGLVCTSLFRNLRFLFCDPTLDMETSKTTVGLVTAVSSSVRGMDLGDLCACLGAVVCSSEKPSFRPGGGVSVLIRAVLDGATELLTSHRNACSLRGRALWEVCFDEFFRLMSKYCFDEYDSIVKSLGGGVDAANAMKAEMPVELLRASLPHTSGEQRKVLLDFVESSMSVLTLERSGLGM